jgi:RimJ/RimL family protein N-acetyltransferase
MIKAPATIDTARLTLCRPSAADAQAIFERYANDSEVTRFLGWPRHDSIDDTRAFLDFSASQWEEWPAGPYLVRSRTDGQLLGSTGLQFETPTAAVTGYVFAKDAWGKGYATESLEAMVHLARNIGVRRLSALCHPNHRPSWHVLEKCAFVRDPASSQPVAFPNLDPGRLQDVLCYVREFA